MVNRSILSVLLISLFAVLIVSCSKEDSIEEEFFMRPVIIHATISENEPATKTSIHDNGKLYWTAAEKINVYPSSGTSISSGSPFLFTSTNDSPSLSVDFSGEADVDDDGTYIALYPGNGSGSSSYWGSTSSGEMAGSIHGYLASRQEEKYEQGTDSFDTSGNAMMAAYSTSGVSKMSFQSVCSGLKFTVSSDGISAISFKGNNGEIVAGSFDLSFEGEGTVMKPVISPNQNQDTEIILSSSGSFKKGAWLYLTTFPQTFEKGITISFKKDGQWRDAVIIENAITFKRGIWKKSANLDDHAVQNDNAFIVFEDAAAKSFCVKKWDTNKDGELSFAEASNVTSLGSVSSSISSFNELRFFTGIETLTYLMMSGGTYQWGNFRMCEKLTSVMFPSSLKFIGRGCFIYCTSLEELVLPSSIEKLSYEVFSSDNRLKNLKTVTVLAATPPNIVSITATIGGGADDGFTYNETQASKLSDNAKIEVVYVPSSSLDAYKSNSQWSTFASRIKPIE